MANITPESSTAVRIRSNSAFANGSRCFCVEISAHTGQCVPSHSWKWGKSKQKAQTRDKTKQRTQKKVCGRFVDLFIAYTFFSWILQNIVTKITAFSPCLHSIFATLFSIQQLKCDFNSHTNRYYSCGKILHAVNVYLCQLNPPEWSGGLSYDTLSLISGYTPG